MHKVKIVGAGIAGLTAALRLLERGYHVTLYEQDNFIGGMLRSHEEYDHGSNPREHSYHMLCNWYFNFWSVAKDLGIERHFTPREAFKFLYKGDLDNMPEMVNPGGIQDFYRNITGGAAPTEELFLFMYSMIDLLSIPDSEDEELDRVSFNGWLRGRPYCTDTVAALHEKIWQTVWAIDSWQASARSYKTFLKYGNRLPVPQLWLFKGSKKHTLLDPFQRKLESYGDKFEWKPLHRLKAIHPHKSGDKIGQLIFDKVSMSPSLFPECEKPADAKKCNCWTRKGEEEVNVSDEDVIISMSPGGLAKLVTDDLYNADPDLGQVRYLEAEPMASVELYLNRKLKNIPDDVVVFMDTDYEMTFLDYSQTWGLEKTFLYVTVSDFKSLLSAEPERRDDNKNLILDLQKPKTAIDYILREITQNLDISVADIDLYQTSIETNTGEELFANLTGSWAHRPEVRTAFSNMFLAGTYVRNFADVATVEGACATGLMAAEAVRENASRRPERGEPGDRIEVITPEAFPSEMFLALKTAWAPYAASAKLWSAADNALGINRFWPPKGFKLPHLKFTPSPEDLGSFFTDFQSRSKWNRKTMGLGPMFWNYTADGKRRKMR
jgi:zeta-carotene desaturase